MRDLIDREELRKRLEETVDRLPLTTNAHQLGAAIGLAKAITVLATLPVARCAECGQRGDVCRMTVGDDDYRCNIDRRFNPATYGCNRWEARHE